MPIYEFRCSSCKNEFELSMKLSDPRPEKCPECGKGPVEKMVSKSSFALKGTGWYRTDYAGGKPAPKSQKKAPKEGGGCAAAGKGPACAGCPGSKE